MGAKVLFVTHDGTSQEPLGLLYLSASLRAAGHETKACMQSRTLDALAAWRPDFAAFQVITGDERRWGNLAARIKDAYPNIRTIFGGPHFLFSEKAKQSEADYVVRGDGEFAIVDIVEGRPHFDLKPIDDLDDVAPPDRSLLHNDDFPGIKNNVILNEQASRGCIFKCTYCYLSNKNWQAMVGKGKDRLRYHSPAWIVDDIARSAKRCGSSLVSFQDDIFGVSMTWLEEFARQYQRVRIPFFAQLRPRLITEDRVKLLKEAGVHIVSFAIESGNEQTRRMVLDRDEPNELIERGAKLLHKHGIKFRMQNMLGLPVDDPLGDAMETLRFNVKCRPTLSWASMLQAYPGTAIADYVVKRGLVKSVDDLTFLVNATFFDECSLPIRDKAKIERLHKYWSAVVRWPRLYWLVTSWLIHINLGKRFQNWIFERVKTYINAKEYWRVEAMQRHVALLNAGQPLDRLGAELHRNPEKEICA